MKKSKAVTEGTQLNTQNLHLNKANCTVSDSSGGINICFFVKKKNGSPKKANLLGIHIFGDAK